MWFNLRTPASSRQRNFSGNEMGQLTQDEDLLNFIVVTSSLNLTSTVFMLRVKTISNHAAEWFLVLGELCVSHQLQWEGGLTSYGLKKKKGGGGFHPGPTPSERKCLRLKFCTVFISNSAQTKVKHFLSRISFWIRSQTKQRRQT